MGNKSNLVRYSRAGDQFHYLWAARRCLGLLSDASGLTLLSIEGVASSEENESGEEIVDAAEYFDGLNPHTCSRIDYHQLKHSTVNLDSPWTLSGFKKTLAGFFERYQALKSTLKPNGELEVSFSFTTNRPVQTEVVEFFDRVKNNALTSEDTKQYELLKSYIGTSDDNEASAFFANFKIDDANASHWQQRNLLHEELGGYIPGPDREVADQLWRLVTEKALPSSNSRPEITREDVLRVLKTDEDELYPAVNLIESGHDHFEREQEREFLCAISNMSDHPVIIHADGGVGKTALAQRLNKSLPDNVEGILFDCFGNGKYRSVTAQRHSHDVGLVQIANELASKKLCHPIIPSRQANDADYLKAFRHRIEQAVSVLRAKDSQAKLVIFIDAADNAQMAAEEAGDATSFAKNLLREEPIDGATFVFLCRSHRIEQLKPPLGFLNLELKPFSLEETSQHILQTFPDASENDVKEFHRLSSQNPRVQATALGKALNLSDTLVLLGPNPTAVEDTIRDIFKLSLDRLLDNSPDSEAQQISIFCEALSALRPFIPIEVLSLVSGMPAGAIRSFINDIGRPLTLSGDAVQFYDEPSETWFRETYRPAADRLKEFVAALIPYSAKNSYIASALPQLMLEAGLYDNLVELALSETGLSELDPAERRSSSLQRLQFSLKAAMRRGRYEDAAKLALKAGGETAGDDRQQSLVQENTHLVSKLYEPHRLREIVAQKSFTTGWYGGQHAYVSALLSGHVDTRSEARSYLRLSHRWVSSWSRLSRDERRQQSMDDEDIAEMAFAAFNISGMSGLTTELSGWSPREVAYRVGKLVFNKLIDRGELTTLLNLDVADDNNVFLSIALIEVLGELQLYPKTAHVEAAYGFTCRSRRVLKKFMKGRGRNIENQAAVCAVAQAVLHYGITSRSNLGSLLKEYIPTPNDYYSRRSSGPSFSTIRTKILWGALSLTEVSVSDFAGEKLQKKIMENASRHERETAEFLNDLGRLLPWHKLWSRAFLGELSKEELAGEIKKCRSDSSGSSRYSYDDDRHLTLQISRLWLEIILLVDPTEAYITELVEWQKELRSPLFIPALVKMGNLCAQNTALSHHTLNFAKEAFGLYNSERSDAETKVSGYCDIARLVYRVSAAEARSYFNIAIEHSGRIGQENIDRSAALIDLADAASNPNHTKPMLAYRFSRVSEVAYDYVARDKYFDWSSTTEALLGLCPSSGVTIISRWKDRRFGWSGRLFPIAIQHLVEAGVLSPKEHLAFIGFRYEWKPGEMLASAVTTGLNKKQIEFLRPYIFNRNMSADAWDNILSISRKIGWDSADVEARRNLIRSISEEPQQFKPSKKKNSPNWDAVAEAVAWFAVFDDIDPTDESDVHLAYRRFKESELKAGVQVFAQVLFSIVPTGQEGTAVRAAFANPNFTYCALDGIFEAIPKRWHALLHFKQDLAAAVEALCQRHCYDISKSRYYQVFPFEKVEMHTGITEKDVYRLVVVALSESPIMLGSGRLFTLAGLMATMLSDDEAGRVLDYGIQLLEADIAPEDGDGPWAPDIEPPESPLTAVAGYLWASLGSPDVEERWEAAHTIGLLCVFESNDLLSRLCAIASGQLPNPYYGKGFKFYEFSAQHWLTLSLYRAIHFGARLPKECHIHLMGCCAESVRNVLLRETASKACLKLYEDDELDLSPAEVLRLTNINAGRPPTKSDSEYNRELLLPESEPDEGDKYFLGHDFESYWCPPLGRIFGLSAAEIERRCLAVVRNELGFRAKRIWEADERSSRGYYRNSERGLYKSSAPRTEDLGFYLSYQSLLIVAGDLIDSTERYQDPNEPDEIKSWIDRYLPTPEDGRWLSDRRDSRPTNINIPDETHPDVPWPYSVTREDLFSSIDIEPGKICVWGYSQLKSDTRHEDISISSALVTPETSGALMRAFQSAFNSRDIRLPAADYDDDLSDDPYKLRGWINTQVHTYSIGIDDYDPWSAGISFPGYAPADWFIQRYNLQPSLDRRHWFKTDEENTPVLTSITWGAQKERYDEDESESGKSLIADRESLKGWLADLEMELIFEVQVTRRFSYKSREAKDDGGLGLSHPYSLILRLDKHGKITTV